MGWPENVQRAKKPRKLPVVFTRDEVRKVMAHLAGTQWIMANLLYGSGLRLMECLRLRVKDIDFGYHQITVREGKGMKDRVTMLPKESCVTDPGRLTFSHWHKLRRRRDFRHPSQRSGDSGTVLSPIFWKQTVTF